MIYGHATSVHDISVSLPKPQMSPLRTSEKWRVEGDYFEGCNCESTCPCIFLANPDHGDCQLTIGWHIDKGFYNSTSLDGLNVVGIFHTPGNMAKGPKWKAAIYLDERAGTEQSEALDKIFSGKAGGFPAVVAGFVGSVMGIKKSRIGFSVEGKRRHLSIPSVLELDAEAMSGSDTSRVPQVTNPALYAAPGFDPIIARSNKYTYHDHGLHWDNSGKNSFYSRFSYSP